MSDILELRQRVEAAEGKFGVSAATQSKYSERLISLVNAVESSAKDAREDQEKTKMSLLAAQAENEQLRGMLHTLLLAMEKDSDAIGPVLRDLEQAVQAITAAGVVGESGEVPTEPVESEPAPTKAAPVKAAAPETTPPETADVPVEAMAAQSDGTDEADLVFSSEEEVGAPLDETASEQAPDQAISEDAFAAADIAEDMTAEEVPAEELVSEELPTEDLSAEASVEAADETVEDAASDELLMEPADELPGALADDMVDELLVDEEPEALAADSDSDGLVEDVPTLDDMPAESVDDLTMDEGSGDVAATEELLADEIGADEMGTDEMAAGAPLAETAIEEELLADVDAIEESTGLDALDADDAPLESEEIETLLVDEVEASEEDGIDLDFEATIEAETPPDLVATVEDDEIDLLASDVVEDELLDGVEEDEAVSMQALAEQLRQKNESMANGTESANQEG